MKKTIFIISITVVILCAFLNINDVTAQEKTTSQLLQAKEWVLQFPQEDKNRSSELKFTASEWISTPIISGHRFEIKHYYYLSSFRTSTFDKQMVGQAVKGKYIIVNSVSNNPENAKVMVYEIIELSDTNLKLKILENGIILPYKSK